MDCGKETAKGTLCRIKTSNPEGCRFHAPSEKLSSPKRASPKRASPKTPKRSTPKRSSPKTPKRASPKQSTPPKRVTPKRASPKRVTPKKSSPKTPKRSTPKRTSPKQSTPKRASPKRSTPPKTPKRSTPKRATPKRASPKTPKRNVSPKATGTRDTYIFSGKKEYIHYALLGHLRRFGLRPYPDSKFFRKGDLIPTKMKLKGAETYYLHVEMSFTGYDHNSYYIKCQVHNLLDSETIRSLILKDLLHQKLHGSEFIARTWPLEKFKYSNFPVIYRPSGIDARAGQGILYADSAEMAEKALEHYNKVFEERKTTIKNPTRQYYKVIVSEYITDPLLWQGRKMHTRIYMIATSEGDPFVISRFGEIFTAAKPFSLDHFDSKEIHDTHGDSTPYPLYFPEDFEHPQYLDKIYRQFDEIAKVLAEGLKLRPFSQAQRAYQLFGLDFMFRGNGDVCLIEINGRPGFGGQKTRKEKEFGDKLDNWIWDNTKHLFKK